MPKTKIKTQSAAAELLSLCRDYTGVNDPTSGRVQQFKLMLTDAVRLARAGKRSKPATPRPSVDRYGVYLKLLRGAVSGTCRNPIDCAHRGCRRTRRCDSMTYLDRLEAKLHAERATAFSKKENTGSPSENAAKQKALSADPIGSSVTKAANVTCAKPPRALKVGVQREPKAQAIRPGPTSNVR